jgi:hypothetical protein
MVSPNLLTNAELDAAIADARADMLEAWDAQAHTTREEGYELSQEQAAQSQAIAAERHYHSLYEMRETRERTRQELGALLSEIRAAPQKWSWIGPWTYAVFGPGKLARAQKLINFCVAHNMPCTFKRTHDGYGYAVTFWRDHASMIALQSTDTDIPEIFPEFSQHEPLWEGNDARELQTTRMGQQSPSQ